MASRSRLTLLGFLLVAIAFVFIAGTALSGALVYYVTPTELRTQPMSRDVRLFGVVVPGSVAWQRGSNTLSFRVTDGSTEVEVATQAIPTALFRDGIGVVLLGHRLTDDQFVAEELLIKHSEVYEPLRPGEAVPPDLLDELRGQATP